MNFGVGAINEDENLVHYSRSSKSSLFSNNFATLTGHGWRVREIAFSPDGSILASGSSDGTIRLWNLSNGNIIHVLSRHHYGVISLDFNPSGEILASGGIDTKINLWNISSGELLAKWALFPHAVIDLKWSSDGKTLAVGGGEWMGDVTYGNNEKKFIQLLNVTSGEVLQRFIGHTDAVSSISFSKDDSLLLTGSWDKTIRLWDVSSGIELQTFKGHGDKITSVTFSHDESTIISAGLDKSINFWDVKKKNISRVLKTNESTWSLALSLVDSSLAVAVDPSLEWPEDYWRFYGQLHDCSIQIWNTTDGKLIDTVVGHKNSIESVKFSLDGTMLASASWDWTVKLWGDYPTLSIEQSLDEWPTSTPEEQGINSTSLRKSLANTVENSRIHSVVIIRHGSLVFEQYYSDYSQVYTPTLKHTHFSATKSFTSALIGIAIDKGYINSVDQRVLDFFPDISISNNDSRKEAITLHHLLSMTTGMEWNDLIDIWGMVVANDSVEYVLSKPMAANPGAEYNYNTGASQLLSAIIQKTTGLSTLEFALKYLFKPLGIEESDVIWMAGSDGINFGGIGLFLTPRNMAKFGQLYLNNGTWNSNQIISKDWIMISSQDHIEGLPRTGINNPSGYGYQFWLIGDAYTALGYGGQMIQIYPTYDLIIVTTAREDEYNARAIAFDVLINLIQESTITTTDTSQNNSQFPILPVLVAITLVILIHRKKRVIR